VLIIIAFGDSVAGVCGGAIVGHGAAA
jgi:hypothetical protein